MFNNDPFKANRDRFVQTVYRILMFIMALIFATTLTSFIKHLNNQYERLEVIARRYIKVMEESQRLKKEELDMEKEALFRLKQKEI